MFYASANRDEQVFEDPFAFRIDRHPNRHLGFGIGEHFCLGANLRASLPAGPAGSSSRGAWTGRSSRASRSRSTRAFVVGLKKLPMRYRIKPAA